jgi:hypothetical protein
VRSWDCASNGGRPSALAASVFCHGWQKDRATDTVGLCLFGITLKAMTTRTLPVS